jgi:hypothetical protein
LEFLQPTGFEDVFALKAERREDQGLIDVDVFEIVPLEA